MVYLSIFWSSLSLGTVGIVSPRMLIFVTTITTAGCVKKLAKCRIFQSEREKLFYTQCKIVHTVQNFTHSFIGNSRTLR